jgi:RecB family exonuclease
MAAAGGGWMPVHFEYSFGLPLDKGHDAASTPDAAYLDEGVRLRGSIDLVERHTARGTLRITDHKTGDFPKHPPAYVAGGSMLQPRGYALAAEKLLGSAVECGRLSFCTQRGGYQEVSCEVSAKTRQWFAHALRLIDQEIERGSLLAAPQAGACEHCDYRPVCGPHEERRSKLKTGDALDGLQELRNIP